MGTEVADLVTKFSFSGTTEPLSEYNNSLGKSIGLLAGMSAAVFAAIPALTAWTAQVNQAIDVNVQLSRVTGGSIEYIQEMGYAASVNGSSVSDFNSSIQALGRSVGEAALGVGRGKATFEQLEISVKKSNGEVKSAQDVFLELTERFKGLSQVEKIAMASKLGINPRLVQLMSKTGKEMDSLRLKSRELGIVTKEQGDAIASYNDSITTQTAAMDGLKQQIAVGLAPELQGMAELITGLIVENKDWIVNGIQAGIGAIGQFGQMIKRISPLLAVMGGIFVVAKIAAFGMAGGFGILLSPVVLITTAIAAAVFIIDDLIVAMDGGESVIADFFDGFGIDIRPKLKATVQFIKDFFKEMVDIMAGYFTWIDDKISGAVGFFKSVSDFFGGESNINVSTQAGQSLAPGQNISNSQSNQTNNVNQSISIDVRSDNPQLVSESINESLQDQLKDARLAYSRG